MLIIKKFKIENRIILIYGDLDKPFLKAYLHLILNTMLNIFTKESYPEGGKKLSILYSEEKNHIQSLGKID